MPKINRRPTHSQLIFEAVCLANYRYWSDTTGSYGVADWAGLRSAYHDLCRVHRMDPLDVSDFVRLLDRLAKRRMVREVRNHPDHETLYKVPP